MVKFGRSWKSHLWLAIILSLPVVTLIGERQPRWAVRRWNFHPPLKGTEILLEGAQQVGSKTRGGIWALDVDTGKVRFLIPHGKRPVWSPQRNYFAYREGGFIHVVHKSGTYDVAMNLPLDGGELVGWGHSEQHILFVDSVQYLVHPQKDPMPGEGGQYFQVLFVGSFNTEERSLETLRHPLDTFEAFPYRHCANPSVCSDGKRIVFEVFRLASGVGRLSSKVAIGEVFWEEKYARLLNVRRLTQLPEELMEVNPKWSPDGKQIAFDVIDPKQGSRTTHVIGADGTGLKGLKLTREEIVRLGSKGARVKSTDTLIRLQEGLVAEDHDNELHVLGWLADGRLVVVEAKYAITRFPDQVASGVWVIDFQRRHPPLLIPRLSGVGIDHELLSLSPTRRQLAWLKSVGDVANARFISLYQLPALENTEAMWVVGVERDWAELKPMPRNLKLLSDLEVYWMNW